MSKRYIELYSANRNRQQYPLTSSFIVPFGSPQLIDIPSQAYDPVTNGVVFYNWQGGNSLLPTGFFKIGSTDNTPLLAAVPLSSVNNYYQGYFINDNTLSQTRTIIGYNPTMASIALDSALMSPANNLNADAWDITDPSNGTSFDIPATGPPYIPTQSLQIHIPAIDGSGRSILSYPQAYNGYYIIDETMTNANGGTPVYAKITNYDFTTNLATISNAFSPGIWSVNDYYTLRKTLPNVQTRIINTTSNSITMGIPMTPYVGKYIYITDITTNILGVPTGFLPYTTSYTNKAYYVLSAVGNTAIINNVNEISPTNVGVSLNNLTANIVSFINDNYIPLLYSGGIVSQSETVCYEISLIDLSLPNVVLVTGSRIAFYPYVYVQLSNVSSSTVSSNNIIYSNNPNSSNALFICTVTDIVQPINSSFVKIDSGSQTQTIKFKPNDTLKFSVFLPDGTLFQPAQTDNYSPYPPNYTLQIDAVFSIKRIS